MTYKIKEESSMGSSSSTPGTLGMYRGSKVISKLQQPPKIRVIHLFPPKIIHADVADFRDVVQRLTGKNAVKPNKKVNGKGRYKVVKQDDHGEEAVIRCDNPTLISPKLEIMMVDTPGSSSSSYDLHHHHHQYCNWRPSPSSSSSLTISGDDHHNNHGVFDGGFLSALEVDDLFDFDSLFGFGASADDHILI